MATRKKKSVKKTAALKETPAKKEEFTAEEKRRMDWEVNNDLISSKFLKLVLATKKFPTYKRLATELNISVKTVQRHFDDEEMFDELRKKMRILREKAYLTLAVKAMQGKSHQWSRLFFEVTDEIKTKENSLTININGKAVNVNKS